MKMAEMGSGQGLPNVVTFGGVLHARGKLRFTPAGLPALDLVVQHDGIAAQEGQPRKVSVQLKALAIGSIVSAVNAMSMGQAAVFHGFLATGRNGRGLVFHIQSIAP